MSHFLGIMGSFLLMTSAIGLVSIALAPALARRASQKQRKQAYFLRVVDIVGDRGRGQIASGRK